MRTKNENLKKLVDYYFSTNNMKLPSKSKLSKELNMSESELRTLLSFFEQCNYIYNRNHHYYIYETKRNFSSKFVLEIQDDYYYFYHTQYFIKFNKYMFINCFERIDTKKITTINELIYLLFLVTLSNNMYIKPTIYLKNNEL